MLAAGVEDALGPGHFNTILGNNDAAGSHSPDEALEGANNDAAVLAGALTCST